MILKKVSAVLLITTVFSSFPVFAATTNTMANTKTIESKESKNKISDWNYTVYDKNGKEKSSGKFSSFDSHNLGFSKTDITLGNGESIVLKPSNSSKGFYCTKGKQMSFSYELSDAASMELMVAGYSDNSGRYDNEINNKSDFYDEYTVPHTDYYYAYIRNVSSDEVTINKFFLYF